MPLNCQAGSLAIVVSEEPGCEVNVGRVVQVLHAERPTGETGDWWVIRPLGIPLWMCRTRHSAATDWVSTQSTRVFIEDRCLRVFEGESRDGQPLPSLPEFPTLCSLPPLSQGTGSSDGCAASMGPRA